MLGTNSDNYPASIYLLKVNDRHTRTRCEICSKLTIKTSERRQDTEGDEEYFILFTFILRISLYKLTLNLRKNKTKFILLKAFKRIGLLHSAYILHFAVFN